MNPYDLFALGAAACWALGSVMSVTPSRHLGAFAFTRWRMAMVAVMLWAVVAGQGSWHSFDGHAWGVMAVSGLDRRHPHGGRHRADSVALSDLVQAFCTGRV